YLIRHGQTDYNKQCRLQGQTDIPLNDYGRELAKITGEGLKDVKFDLAISSPLGRAVETTKLVVGDQVKMITDDRIKEISFGDYEGLCFGEQGYNIPDPDFSDIFKALSKGTVPPNGEGLRDVLERTKEFLEDLIHNPDYQEKTIFISAHGCVLRALLSNIKKTKFEDFWIDGVHPNCAVTILNVTDGVVEIVEEGKVYYGPKDGRV
ncbi:MAG: histidine phosphatase family protein, partial [Clostridiales bacterium]|nr:histidine phosphatase family protein [Clostridiales bacterium]